MIVRMSGMGAASGVTNPLDPRTFPPVMVGETFDQYYLRVSAHVGRAPIGFQNVVRTFYEDNRPRTAAPRTATSSAKPSLLQIFTRGTAAAAAPPPIPAPPPRPSIFDATVWSAPQPSSGVLPTATPAQTAEAAYQQIVATVTGSAPAGSVETASGPLVPVNTGPGSGFPGEAGPVAPTETPENAAFVAATKAANERRTYWIVGGIAALVGGYFLFGGRQASS